METKKIEKSKTFLFFKWAIWVVYKLYLINGWSLPAFVSLGVHHLEKPKTDKQTLLLPVPISCCQSIFSRYRRENTCT